MGAVQVDSAMIPERPGALERSLRFDNVPIAHDPPHQRQHQHHARSTGSSGALKQRDEQRHHTRRGRPRSGGSDQATERRSAELHQSGTGTAGSASAGDQLPVLHRSTARPPAPPLPAAKSPRAQAASPRARSRTQMASPEQEPRGQVWGMPPFYADDAGPSDRAYGKEVAPGVKLITADELAELMHIHATTDVPSSVLFPWLHGIGDGPKGLEGGALEEFFGYPSCSPPPYRGLTIMRVPTPLLRSAGGLESGAVASGKQAQIRPGPGTGDAAAASPASLVMERDDTVRAREAPAQQSRSSTPVPCTIACPKPASWDAMKRWSAAPAAHVGAAPGGELSGQERLSARTRSASYSTTVSTSASSEMSSEPSFLSLSVSHPRDSGFPHAIWGRGPAASVDSCSGYSPSSSVSSSVMWRADDDQDKEGQGKVRTGNSSGSSLDDHSCMHPTASKSKLASGPTSTQGLLERLETSEAALHARGALHCALTGHSGAENVQVPARPSSASPSISSYHASLLDAAPMQRSRSTGPLSRHMAPTPRVSMSPDPSDPKSGLRSVSTSGRSRNHSPVPSRPGTPRFKAPGGASTAPANEKATAPAGSGSAPPSTEGQAAGSTERTVSALGAQPNCRLVNSSSLDDLLDVLDPGTHDMSFEFKRPKLSPEVSLRNLNVQEVKYTTISDIVLYGPAMSIDPSVKQRQLLALAQRVADAQDRLARQRLQMVEQQKQQQLGYYSQEVQADSAGALHYGVYVVQDEFSHLQARHPSLIAVDQRGCPKGSLDLAQVEIDESLAFSGATEIAEGVWLGNAYDNPFRDGAMISDPPPYDLVVEAHDSACNPTTDVLAELKRAFSEYKHRARNPAFKLRDILSTGCSAAPAPMIAECISSSKSFGCHGQTIEQTATGLIAVVELVKRFIGERLLSRSDGSRSRPKVLVYCDDGYTETSLFALTYLMVSQHLTLCQAYLQLHLNGQRNFFVYPFDVGLLLRIERKVMDRQELGVSPPSPSKLLQSGTRWKPWGLGFSRGPGGGRIADATGEDSHYIGDKGAVGGLSTDRRWLTSSHFDGSFPSLLLPGLYLGHLDHASNPQLLNALGITHVVSVGEPILVESLATRDHYIWRSAWAIDDEFAGQLGASRIEVLELSGVKDDGNDPLRPKIDLACDYIHRAHKSGGKTLVHCRVGVSRSATICIAYLMKHHNMSLVKAYMLTRARRLNVLIQPNLRFLHELLGWEIQLCAEQSTDSSATPKMPEQFSDEDGAEGAGVIRYSWPHLCKAIDQLNKRYLSPQG